jgi:glycine C-acetyltransferase
LSANASLLRDELRTAGFDTMGSVTQIVPVFVGGAEETMEFSRRLFDAGIFVQGIRPPTVPAGSCRLRFTLMATHGEDDIRRAVAALSAAGRESGLPGRERGAGPGA